MSQIFFAKIFVFHFHVQIYQAGLSFPRRGKVLFLGLLRPSRKQNCQLMTKTVVQRSVYFIRKNAASDLHKKSKIIMKKTHEFHCFHVGFALFGNGFKMLCTKWMPETCFKHSMLHSTIKHSRRFENISDRRILYMNCNFNQLLSFKYCICLVEYMLSIFKT